MGKFSKLLAKLTGSDKYTKQRRQGKKIKANTDTDEQHEDIISDEDAQDAAYETKEKKIKARSRLKKK